MRARKQYSYYQIYELKRDSQEPFRLEIVKYSEDRDCVSFSYETLEDAMQAAQDYEDVVVKQSKSKKQYLSKERLLELRNHLAESPLIDHDTNIVVSALECILDCFEDE